jgi:hypothetical protein
VFWGDLDTIVEKLEGHVKAGADHRRTGDRDQPGYSAMAWRALGHALLPQGASA